MMIDLTSSSNFVRLLNYRTEKISSLSYLILSTWLNDAHGH